MSGAYKLNIWYYNFGLRLILLFLVGLKFVSLNFSYQTICCETKKDTFLIVTRLLGSVSQNRIWISNFLKFLQIFVSKDLFWATKWWEVEKSVRNRRQIENVLQEKEICLIGQYSLLDNEKYYKPKNKQKEENENICN